VLGNDAHLFNRVSNIGITRNNGFSVSVLLLMRDNKCNTNVDINVDGIVVSWAYTPLMSKQSFPSSHLSVITDVSSS
jgi:hypothetical protein